MEELGNKLQTMFKAVYEAADLKYIRPIKRQMFTSAIECLDERNSVKQADKCIEESGKVLHAAMNIVQEEINSFQGRVDRCLMNCQDDVRNERDETKGRLQFESCAAKCLDQFQPMVPEVAKGLCQKLDKLKRDNKIK